MTGGAHSPLSRERWALLEPLIDTALELDENGRAAFISRLARQDPDLAADLRRLLDQADRGIGVLEAAAAERDVLLVEPPNAGLHDRLRGDLQASLDGYVIEGELGGGGMSRVFVARDSRLDRRVVIKVLMPRLNASLSVERFARETKLSASLQQANIVPVIAAGSAAGLPYFVMPFVEGQSLRERLVRDGPLPLGETIGILRDVARALAYAHKRGIVHRDIKPGNVLLSGGAGVVTDFGIAKALVDAASSSSSPADHFVTDAGTTVGTPSYMAPEQAIGDPGTDCRADIYAFGCMAYEMVTGKPPFSYDAKHRVIAAHLKEEPPSVVTLRPDAAPIAVLIARCLAKEPGQRPQTADELLDGLDRAGPPRSAERAKRAVPMLVSGAIGAALLIGTWSARRELLPTARPASASPSQASMSQLATSAPRRGTTTNLMAYELNLRGRDPMLMRSDSTTRVALKYFQQAIALDSTFAPAYAGLARMYTRLAISNNDAARNREFIALGRAAATKAIAIDDSLADAHFQLGFVESAAHQYSLAERELRRALELDPRLTEAHETLAVTYEMTERPREALSQARQAVRDDPLSRSAIAEYSRALYYSGDCDAALAEAAKVSGLRPPLLRVSPVIAFCDAEKSRWADAVAAIEPQARGKNIGSHSLGVLGNVLARGGRRAEAEGVRAELMRRRLAGHAGADDIALVEAGLGNVDAALAWCDTAVTELAIGPDLMGPALASVRRDPRFDRIRERLGIRRQGRDE